MIELRKHLKKCKKCKYYSSQVGFTRWVQKEPQLIHFCSMGNIYKNKYVSFVGKKCPSFKRRDDK